MIVEFNKIKAAIAKIRGTVAKSTAVESHKLICIQDNKLHSFDGTTGTVTNCELPGFRFCVGSNEFMKLVDVLGDKNKQGTLTHDNGWLHARVGEYESKIPTFDVIDFPDFMPKGATKVFCSATNLIEALRACSSAMEDDEKRSQICGIAFKGSYVYSTDGKRMTRADLNAPVHPGEAVALAKPAIQQLIRLGQPKYLFMADSKVGGLFDEIKTVLVARSVVGQFPFHMVDATLNVVSPEWSFPVPEELLEAVERVSALVRDEESQLLLSCNGEWLTISTSSNQTGQAQERIPFVVRTSFKIKIKASTLRSSIRQLKPTHINLTDVATSDLPRALFFSGPNFLHACALMS